MESWPHVKGLPRGRAAMEEWDLCQPPGSSPPSGGFRKWDPDDTRTSCVLSPSQMDQTPVWKHSTEQEYFDCNCEETEDKRWQADDLWDIEMHTTDWRNQDAWSLLFLWISELVTVPEMGRTEGTLGQLIHQSCLLCSWWLLNKCPCSSLHTPFSTMPCYIPPILLCYIDRAALNTVCSRFAT